MLAGTGQPLAQDCAFEQVASESVQDSQVAERCYALLAPLQRQTMARVCLSTALREETVELLKEAGWEQQRSSEILQCESEIGEAYRLQVLKQCIEHHSKETGSGLVWVTEGERDEALCRALHFYPIHCRAPIGDFCELTSAERPAIVWARPLRDTGDDLARTTARFLHRWASLCSSAYIRLPSRYLTGVASYAMAKSGDATEAITADSMLSLFDSSDLDRLGRFVSPGLDVSLVGDLWLPLALLFFRGHCGGHCATEKAQRVDALELTPFQKIALMGLGLQGRTVDALAAECELPKDQMSIQFQVALRRYREYLMAVKAAEVAKQVEQDISEITRSLVAGELSFCNRLNSNPQTLSG